MVNIGVDACDPDNATVWLHSDLGDGVVDIPGVTGETVNEQREISTEVVGKPETRRCRAGDLSFKAADDPLTGTAFGHGSYESSCPVDNCLVIVNEAVSKMRGFFRDY